LASEIQAVSDQRWDYPGVSSPTAHRHDDLSLHPTVKPTALVADAIRDCTKRNEIVLDSFGGSGTTLIRRRNLRPTRSPHRVRPVYCDTIVMRWERLTGKQAKLSGTGESFEDIAELRSNELGPERRTWLRRKTGCGRHLVKSALANHRRMGRWVKGSRETRPARPKKNSKTPPDPLLRDRFLAAADKTTDHSGNRRANYYWRRGRPRSN